MFEGMGTCHYLAVYVILSSWVKDSFHHVCGILGHIFSDVCGNMGPIF